MCQLVFAHGPHAGETSDSCKAAFCDGHRHHWLRIKRMHGPLNVEERAELAKYNKHADELMLAALVELEEQGVTC